MLKNADQPNEYDTNKTFTTEFLADIFKVQRSNLSAKLNELTREGKLEKIPGRPVKYCIKKSNNHKSSFDQLIGSEGSLQSSIEIAKAVLIYPEKGMHIILEGESGTGKSLFANTIYRYAQDQEIFSDRAPLIKLNVKDYHDEAEKLENKMFGSTNFDMSVLSEAKNGMLFIDYLDSLPIHLHERLIYLMDHNYFKKNRILLVGSMEVSSKKGRLESFLARNSVRIDIPSLKARGIKERYSFVKYFIDQEQSSMGKKLKIDSELFHCLLLYPCKQNIAQIRQDIKLACAKAYARELHHKGTVVVLDFSDFPQYVKEGLFFINKNLEEIDQLIPKQHAFIFDDGNMLKGKKSFFAEDDLEPIYDLIERKTSQLEQRGVEEQDIVKLVFAEVESRIQKLQFEETKGKLSRENLAKIVDPAILDLANSYLSGATERFKRVYSESLYYGLCLHLSALLERDQTSQKYSLVQIKLIGEKYREEYGYAVNFASRIEDLFHKSLSVDETVFLTLFISEGVDNQNTFNSKTSILIAMHGNSTASSLAEVVKLMSLNENVYSFDMPLDMGIDEAYQLFSKKVRDIYAGDPILMLYDMGSFKSMAEMIMDQSSFEIKLLELPYTMVALDLARKALSLSDPNSIYESVVENFRKHYSNLSAAYKHDLKKKIIITLCMSGEGAAVRIKDYLEKYTDLKEIDIIPLAVNHRSEFIFSVNQLRKEHNILSIIGTYDPQIYGVPFISLSQFFSTPTEGLEILLSLKPREYPEGKTVSILEMIDSMQDYLAHVDLVKLKKILPGIITKITKGKKYLSQDQILGLSLHIASYIDRLKSGTIKKSKPNDSAISQKEEKLIKQLKKDLEDLEIEFYIEFEDNELINIVKLIQQK